MQALGAFLRAPFFFLPVDFFLPDFFVPPPSSSPSDLLVDDLDHDRSVSC
jgi:hypothetical protein